MTNLENIVGDWDKFFGELFEGNKKIVRDLNKVNSLYQERDVVIYPDQNNVFRAFKECHLSNLSVVILLQDPYHDGSATGIALANEVDRKLSPSLRIVKNTIAETIYNNQDFNFDPTLINWARQGVLMLNTALTVEKFKPSSHISLWEEFTRSLLTKLSKDTAGVIYCLWGKYSMQYQSLIKHDTNHILTCTHPAYAVYRHESWKCNHFVEINKLLNNRIIW